MHGVRSPGTKNIMDVASLWTPVIFFIFYRQVTHIISWLYKVWNCKKHAPCKKSVECWGCGCTKSINSSNLHSVDMSHAACLWGYGTNSWDAEVINKCSRGLSVHKQDGRTLLCQKMETHLRNILFDLSCNIIRDRNLDMSYIVIAGI